MLTKNELKEIMLDRNDGPITEFVAIHRAVELVYNPKTKAEDIANALYESLEEIREHGVLTTNERLRN